MYKKSIYKKAYRLLEKFAPLKFDCGLLCNKKCCSGDNNSGMHLFPGEEMFLEGKQNFLNLRSERTNDIEVFFAVCEGICNRSYRPLACRIYPLVPYIDPAGRLTIIEDPRAKYICPLLMRIDGIHPDKRFTGMVKKVFQLLAQDPEIKAYLIKLSGILNEYSRFTRS